MFLLLILGPSSYQQVLALGRQTYHEGGYKHLPLAITPAAYQLLKGGLLATAAACGVLLALLYIRIAAVRQDTHLLGQELHRAVKTLLGTARHLSRLQQLVGGGLLVVLLSVRVWYLTDYVLNTDEVASYDYFVRPGLLTISSFYPIPNNHLLFNFLCWPLSLFSHDVRLVMRLPTFVASAVGTLLGYLLLIRWSGFRVATLATGLFSFLPLGLYYAVAGRGYFLQLALLILAFFAVLAVWQVASYRRLGWVLFVTSSILGFYTIPTFLYPFLALSSGLLVGLVWQRRWLEIGHLVLAGSIVGLTTLLLYLPVLCVSGVQQLVGNHYVATMADTVFWNQYLRYLRSLADMLAGNGRIGMVAGGALMALGPALVWLLPRPNKALAIVAWLLVLLPIPLMAVQQVLVPPRALLCMSYFGCVLGSLVAIALLTRLRVAAKYQLALSLLLVGAYGAYQFRRQLAPHQDEVREEQQMQAAYAWLTNQGKTRVLLAAPTYELFFRHYAQQENRSLLLHSSPAPGQQYDYTVQGRDGDSLPTWAQPPFYTPVYENKFVVIYSRKEQESSEIMLPPKR
ncbi:hypothetical protein MTX78_11495 [Hymenobacter tibetensis]|uniref:Glycosyltransferase RgtA/B/C/D-like domain-containing protein n=1 Tax=Hymenobacter tibetensis TaxID=497967 RepID=A0ABY4CU86_9BACT|nr:hypothetical protein [Hymenobacter tibetensis]UOG72750.1 hypothetical protein MTX78_11495 [Hymenobacter tibetensis]